jgi:trehalose 6-phosphate phosphatase
VTTTHILDDAHRPTLAAFALSNVLLAFDYDGTLAPIAASPQRARMRPQTRELLASVARLYPCVVISGRALDDIARRLSGVPVWHVFGNHGLEPFAGERRSEQPTRAWVRKLRRDLAHHPGVVVEDKRLTVTVHYRGARDRARALRAIDDAVRALPGARIVGGKEAVNLLPFGGADKGVAVRDALRLFACQTCIYVGDDDTDEDAFAAAPSQMLGIRVGAATASNAKYHVVSQGAVDELLAALVDLRSGRQSHARGPR